jgi:uncharacterized Zn ribbon protein
MKSVRNGNDVRQIKTGIKGLAEGTKISKIKLQPNKHNINTAMVKKCLLGIMASRL